MHYLKQIGLQATFKLMVICVTNEAFRFKMICITRGNPLLYREITAFWFTRLHTTGAIFQHRTAQRTMNRPWQAYLCWRYWSAVTRPGTNQAYLYDIVRCEAGTVVSHWSKRYIILGCGWLLCYLCCVLVVMIYTMYVVVYLYM